MERLHGMIRETPHNVKAKIVDNHIILDIIGEDLHYWSPQLNFRVDQDENNIEHAVVAGIIGPRPTVWTLFIFIYFLIGFTGFVLSSYGVSKMLMDEYSNLIFAFPIALLLMLSAYKIGKYGERLGADQIELLKQFVRNAIRF